MIIIGICSRTYSQADTTGTPDTEYTFTVDTVFAYLDGLDSIFTIETDTTGLDTILLRNSYNGIYHNESANYAKTFINPMEIGIDIGFQTRSVNDGLFGFHVGNIFTPGALPAYEEQSDAPLQWLQELQPKSLRFPAGGASKFMHLRPYRNIDGQPGLDPIKGYGYDIEEIIRFYDVTDDVINITTASHYADILADMADNGECNDCNSWMDDANFKLDFKSFYSKWEKQESLPADAPSAIEQFVDLVNAIQVANPGLTVDIIICLNIFSESATRCKNIIKYLKLESENGIADLHVAGVELGNENYFKSSKEMLGMEDFEDYWSFINGGSSDVIWWEDFKDHVFTYAMKTDHDYIAAFKLDNTVACKIGIPATNIDEEGYALKESGELSETGAGPTWNELLRNHYDERVETGGPFAFDAVIIHPYYTARDNFQDIALLFDASYSCPVFDYSGFDSRLEPAFNGILGTSPTPLFGNFRDFIRSRYLESFDYHNEILDFSLTTNYKKELWTTEWNLLDEYVPIETEANIKERMNIYNNSFAGAFLIHEWWLQNLKLNYTRNYRNNFFTYSHFHNYHGTEYQNTLLSDADCADLKRMGLYPEYTEDDRLYIRRTNYFTMKHLSPIARRDLKYIRNNQYISALNPNIQTTTFLTPDNDSVYIYYSNIRPEQQHYIINGEAIQLLLPDDPLYGPPIGVNLGNATIHCIDALQPYSNSGKSSVYDLNYCYDCHNTPPFWHPFEIMAENPAAIRNFPNTPACITPPMTNETCVTVPAYSVGYFKLPVSAVYASPKSQQSLEFNYFVAYPNPASEYIQLHGEGASTATLGEVITASGVRIFTFNPSIEQIINISALPAGAYLIRLGGAYGYTYTTFIKQ